MNITRLDLLGKYLGCPAFQRRPNASTFKNFFLEHWQNWKGGKLTAYPKQVGCCYLISFWIPFGPYYAMLYAFAKKLVLWISLEISFWKKSNTQKGLPLISWDKTCQPKSRDELRLRKVEATNKAFQCKLAWKIFTDIRSYRVKSMTAKYLHNTQRSWSTSWSQQILLFRRVWFVGNYLLLDWYGI